MMNAGITLPEIKICGLQTASIVKSFKHLPIDYVGFVFAKSSRQVTAEHAARLIDALKASEQRRPIQTVGVFVDSSEQEVERIVRTAGLDVVQLHGREKPEFCRRLKETLAAKVWKVWPVSSAESELSSEHPLDHYRSWIDAILLDTYDPIQSGGTGMTFAWEAIPTYRQIADEMNLPLWVAGGLTPDNVRHLLAAYEVDGVDVSSGVESDGVKDVEKITAFVERVKP